MNRNRIILFASLGVLVASVSILAAKKFKKGKKSKWVNREEHLSGAPEMRGFGGSTK